MRMTMVARQMSRTLTTLDRNVVIVVPTTLLSGEGVKLGISFVTHVVCMLVFEESLGLCHSRETKSDRDPNTFPNEIFVPHPTENFRRLLNDIFIIGRHVPNIIYLIAHTHISDVADYKNHIYIILLVDFSNEDAMINLDTFFFHPLYIFLCIFVVM